MTASFHPIEYSYGLVKKCFPKIRDISKCHEFHISDPILIIFASFCSDDFSLSSERMLSLARICSLTPSVIVTNEITRDIFPACEGYLLFSALDEVMKSSKFEIMMSFYIFSFL